MTSPSCTSLHLIVFAAFGLGTAQSAEFDIHAYLGIAPAAPRPAHDAPITLFQTNSAYDPRIAIPVDGVIVHRHGDTPEVLKQVVESWLEHDFAVGRMFFADSDAGNHYTQGRFDGETHFEDIELDRNGNRVLCAGVRPYMLPTPGWTDYLKTQVRLAIDAGATSILPEEPLAHNHTGYEESFRRAFTEEYGIPWQGGHESPDAFFRTARLKSKLYRRLEQDLCDFTHRYAREQGTSAEFIIPIHSIFSNLSARLVAPLGTSLSMTGTTGYIGQIWTGPVRWTIGGSSVRPMTFFDSAYVNYDYFVNLVIDSPRRLYLLADPVEDDPQYRWDEYHQWYRECLVAKLMFTTINTYEVMPWPDRIFLPGHGIGGGTPGPGEYRTTLMSCLTALQSMPAGTRDDLEAGTRGIGMLIADSAMWQNSNRPVQDPFMGMLVPLLRRGVPVSSVPMERCGDREYMANFRLLMLSFEAFKPHSEEMLRDLGTWVREGGVLLLFKTTDEFDDIGMFWKRAGYASAQAYLCAQLGIDERGAKADTRLGPQACTVEAVDRGHLVIADLTPSSFVDESMAAEVYLPLLRACSERFLGGDLEEPGALVARRGRYVVAHTFDRDTTLEGDYVDVFSSDLPLIHNPRIGPDTSVLLLNVADLISGPAPAVLHATYRLKGRSEGPRQTAVLIQGPAETTAAVRVYTAGQTPASVEARRADGTAVEVELKVDGSTALLSFPGDPSGVGLRIGWQAPAEP